MTLEQLVEALERAPCGSDELDRQVARYCGRDGAPWTQDLSASFSLKPPGWTVQAYWTDERALFRGGPDGEKPLPYEGDARRPALAACALFIRGRAGIRRAVQAPEVTHG